MWQCNCVFLTGIHAKCSHPGRSFYSEICCRTQSFWWLRSQSGIHTSYFWWSGTHWTQYTGPVQYSWKVVRYSNKFVSFASFCHFFSRFIICFIMVLLTLISLITTCKKYFLEKYFYCFYCKCHRRLFPQTKTAWNFDHLSGLFFDTELKWEFINFPFALLNYDIEIWQHCQIWVRILSFLA